MREIRPSGSEGGVTAHRHPYPYQNLAVTKVHGKPPFVIPHAKGP
jgi:hypothetical protein